MSEKMFSRTEAIWMMGGMVFVTMFVLATFVYEPLRSELSACRAGLPEKNTSMVDRVRLISSAWEDCWLSIGESDNALYWKCRGFSSRIGKWVCAEEQEPLPVPEQERECVKWGSLGDEGCYLVDFEDFLFADGEVVSGKKLAMWELEYFMDSAYPYRWIDMRNVLSEGVNGVKHIVNEFYSCWRDCPLVPGVLCEDRECLCYSDEPCASGAGS